MSQNTNNLAAYCWSIADLLRGDFKQSQYGRIILPFTLLRRLECVLEDSKEAVLAEYDKVRENELVMKQIENNSPEQAMLGDFGKAVDDAVLDSSESHQNQMMQLLSNPEKAKGFAKVVFDLLKLAE